MNNSNRLTRIRYCSLEVNLSVVIGSFLVGIPAIPGG